MLTFAKILGAPVEALAVPPIRSAKCLRLIKLEGFTLEPIMILTAHDHGNTKCKHTR